MDFLSWELAILNRILAYPNLSSAATHVGLSQPQLSRILKRIEDELGLALLDRKNRRLSAWTSEAFRLREILMSCSQNVEVQVSRLSRKRLPKQVRFGILEGLLKTGSQIGHQLLSSDTIQTLELDVFDLSHLEEKFLKGDLDLILSSREPSKKKFEQIKKLGWQEIQNENLESSLKAWSLFDSVQSKRRGAKKSEDPNSKVLLSQSLAIRNYWVQRFGAAGYLISDLKTGPKNLAPNRDTAPVFLIGNESFPQAYWSLIA